VDVTSRQAHWQGVYSSKRPDEVSWFQETPAVSLELMRAAGVTQASSIIDVGGGASRLVDTLMDAGYQNLTVLDLSAAALAASKARLGQGAAAVTWIAADVTTWQPPKSRPFNGGRPARPNRSWTAEITDAGRKALENYRAERSIAKMFRRGS